MELGHRLAIMVLCCWGGGQVGSFPGLEGTHSQEKGEARDGLQPSWA